jgi:two-component system response regulator QseB/two-component system response regulator TctD
MKILIVEDQASVRTIVADHLFERGFIVDAVGTIEEARAALHVSRYSGIIMDLGLPDGDGLCLLQDAGGIATLIVSGRASTEERVTGLNAGADDYLAKPFHLEELEARLRTILRRAPAHRAANLSCGTLSYDPVSLEVTVRGIPINMTKRECALLECLLRASGSPVTVDSLKGKLDTRKNVRTNALESALSRLRARLVEAGADVRIESTRGGAYRLMTGRARDGAFAARCARRSLRLSCAQ